MHTLPSRTPGFAGLLAVACMLGMLAGAATPSVSLAARAHAQLPSITFGGPGTVAGEAGSLSLAHNAAVQPGSGLAVSEVTHDVYVADTGNHRVDEFTAEGKFVRAWGWGVSTGAAAFQVCEATCRVGLSGSEPGEFETASYIAVDNAVGSPSRGDVYVADTAAGLVTKFDGEGHLISSWGNNGEDASHKRTEPNGQLNGSPTELFNEGIAGFPIEGIAVDGSGDLWVYNLASRLFEFAQDGSPQEPVTAITPASPGGGGISVSETCASACSLLVHDGTGQVQQLVPHQESTATKYENSGRVTAGNQEAEGVGIDNTDGDVYLVRGQALVEDLPGECADTAPSSGCLATQAFGERESTRGIVDGSGLAVDSSSGTVYVSDAGTDTVDGFPVVVETLVGPASGVGAHGAVLHGSVDPFGGELSSCRFEYGPTSGEFTDSVPCVESPGVIGAGNTPVAVEAPVTDLVGGVTYYFRVRAVNRNGGASSEQEALSTLVTPVVSRVEASELSGSQATLVAEVNPASQSLGAHYHFEYGVCPEGACAGAPYTSVVPEPDAEIAAGTSDVRVSQAVTGLTAGVTYHFRITIGNANGDTSPTEGVFVFKPAGLLCSLSRPVLDSGLADCRAYEMVTPADKNAALINNGVFLSQPSVSAGGSRVLMQSIQCFHGPSSCTAVRQTEGSTYAFEYAEGGWKTTPLTPPISTGNSVLTYNADTGDVLYAAPSVPAGFEDLWAREANGTVREIGQATEAPGPQIEKISPEHYATTADLSRIVYEGRGLWPSMEAGPTSQVFTYPGSVLGRPDLVGVSGGPQLQGAEENLISACGTTLGGDSHPRSLYGSLSEDGEAVVFTAEACGTGTGVNKGVGVPDNELFERVGGARTVFVSGSGPIAECNSVCQSAPPGDASFEGASNDGSDVFFTDTRQLLNGASEDRRVGDSASRDCTLTSPVSSGCNLYEFVCPEHCADESAKELVDVSGGDLSGLGPRVQGVVAIPPGGSDVYFVAQGVLTQHANQAGAEPVAGLDNLYVYRAGSGMRFITTLPSSDEDMWHKQGGIGIANVTPDGRYLVFTSHRALTGDVSRGEGLAQVYRYDSSTGSLVRVSLGQDGFNDNGNAGTTDARIVNADQSFANGDGPGSSNPSVSDDGGVVVFESSTGLTPGALDDRAVIGNPAVLAENVYEWEAPGAQPSPSSPACSDPDGCVSLISDGKDRYEGTDAHANESATELLGVDPTGKNIFFWSADPILPSDRDSQLDLYDARVDGGFEEPAAVEPCGTLEGCHDAADGSEPAAPLISSALFSGPGNLVGSPSKSPSTIVKKTAAQVRAEKLAKALKVCRKRRGRPRASCERAVRKRFAPAKKAKQRKRRK
jgi:hypothetical protein